VTQRHLAVNSVNIIFVILKNWTAVERVNLMYWRPILLIQIPLQLQQNSVNSVGWEGDFPTPQTHTILYLHSCSKTIHMNFTTCSTSYMVQKTETRINNITNVPFIWRRILRWLRNCWEKCEKFANKKVVSKKKCAKLEFVHFYTTTGKGGNLLKFLVNNFFWVLF
jgi:hypothetical protein